MWKIRKAEQKDIKDIIEIIKEVHINNIEDRSNGFLASEDLSEKTYSSMIEKYDYCYVCELKNRVVGFLIASSVFLMNKDSEIYSFLINKNLFKDFIYIFQVGIAKDFQRKGIATLIYNKLFKESGANNFMVITSKNPFNKASRELHLKLGFKDVDVFVWSDGIESYVYQLSNLSYLPVDVLEDFLREANLNTYANESAGKCPSLRPMSNDYHFKKDNLVYHDTYFGATKFIGEEIVYKDGNSAWGMNYYGFVIDNDVGEELIDLILRPALMSGSGENIPVRGPKEFLNGEWKYSFKVDGSLFNFTGTEEVFKNDRIVYRLYCHGGFLN